MGEKEQAREALKALMTIDKEKAGIVGRYMGRLVSQDVVALGEGEVFALRDKRGKIVGTKQAVKLSSADGTLMQPVKGGPHVISAFGYQKIAEASGAVVINAPTVVVDGKEQPNPFCRRDSQGNVIEVHCRALAFRYGKGGQPVVSDRTAVFDLVTYLKTDMIGKAKYCPQAFRLRPKGNPPAEEGAWCEYNIDFAVSLFLNAAHEEAIKFLGQTLNRQKKAMEFAQTFAQRNALKHLFGLDKSPKEGQVENWLLETTAWRSEAGGMIGFSAAQFQQGVKQIENVMKGEEATVISGMDTIETEADILDGADVEDHPEVQDAAFSNAEPVNPVVSGAETPEPAHSDAEMKAWNNLQIAKKEFEGEYQQAVSELQEEPTPANAEKFLSKINQILDSQAVETDGL